MMMDKFPVEDFIIYYSFDIFDELIVSDVWIKTILNNLFPVAICISEIDNSRTTFFINQLDVLAFLHKEPDKKIWIVSESTQCLHLSQNDFKSKYKNHSFLYVLDIRLVDKFSQAPNIKELLVDYCLKSGNFNSLTEIFETSSYKYFKFEKIENWYDEINAAVSNFKNEKQLISEYLVANCFTFSQFGFFGNYEYDNNCKIFGDNDKLEIFDDIFPNLDFCFSELIPDNQFVLICIDDFDETDNLINLPKIVVHAK